MLSLGTSSGGALLGQVTASLAAALAIPLLDGGRRDAERDAALARERAAALEVRRAVQQALGEVESALSTANSSRARLEAQQRAVQEAEASVADARTLYTAGLAGFLDVLDAQRALFQAQQLVLISQAAQLQNLVNLYKALGGGWSKALN